MSYPGVGVSPGTVPVYHKTSTKASDWKVRVVELILRCLMCGLSVVAAVLVGTDSQVREIFAIRKEARFTDTKSLVFLVIANAVAASYSLIQASRSVAGMIRGDVLFSKPLAWVIFSGDQVMAYAMVAAVAASLESAVLAKLGQPELQWMKICDLYERFCTQVGEGIGCTVLVSLGAVASSGISAYGLFRLYGGNKGGSPPQLVNPSCFCE